MINNKYLYLRTYLIPTINTPCTELVLNVMDAGYCLYIHIFMKNIKSLKPFNFLADRYQAYAIGNPSVRPSVRLSVTLVYCGQTA